MAANNWRTSSAVASTSKSPYTANTEEPARTLRWGVWETPAYDGLVARGHDDLLISAALTAVLDRQEWPGTGPSAVVTTHKDVLQDIDSAEW